MTSRDAWVEVGERLQALGLKLKLHAKEELSERDAEDLKTVSDRVRSAVEEVADALNDAAKDPAVRADVRGVADALSAAATATVEEMHAALKRRS